MGGGETVTQLDSRGIDQRWRVAGDGWRRTLLRLLGEAAPEAAVGVRP
jgi:hypothetical protein